MKHSSSDICHLIIALVILNLCISFLHSMNCCFFLHILPLNNKWGDNDFVKDSLEAWHFISSVVLKEVVSCAFIDSSCVSQAVVQWKLICPVLSGKSSCLWMEITSNKWEKPISKCLGNLNGFNLSISTSENLGVSIGLPPLLYVMISTAVD